MTVLQESLSARYDSGVSAVDFAAAGQDLLSVVDLLAGERGLRAMLADPAIRAEAKKRTMAQLLTGKISPLAASVIDEIATARWSSDADLVDACEIAGSSLVLMAAEKEARIDRVEEELFRFGRAIDANAQLQMALTNPAMPAAAKQGIVHTLLDGKSATETVTLLAQGTGNLRGRRIQAVVIELSELAAARRGRVIAEIRTAVSLTATQESRLAAVLTQLHGRPVELNINLDPSVIGGIEVCIGDEVVDGTISSRIDQARRRMAG